MSKVIVCGGRAYANRKRLFEVLDAIHQTLGISEVIQGGATGADALAKEWALDRGVAMTECKANWKKHGLAAGPIRNQSMLDRCMPTWVVAFPGGTGTADMIHRSTVAGVAVVEPKP